VSRTEDRTIFADSVASANSPQHSDLRDLGQPGSMALPLPLEGMLHDSGSSMKHLALLLAGFALSSATLHAQSSPGVPDSHRPPPGMCRIWIDGVPPTHQPAPTDCATAIRKRPMNARVVFGNDAPSGSQRSFAPVRPGQSNFAAPSSQIAPNGQSAPSTSHEEQDRIAQEHERQRIAAQREQQRVEAQRVHDEQEKRAVHHDAPPMQHGSQDHAAPSPRPRTEHQARPPRSSFSARRPR
jgi:hypothetical protein